MRECRIVKVTSVDGRVKYVIERRHWLFRWMWQYMAFKTNKKIGPTPFDYLYKGTYDTIEEAKENLCRFDGTKIIEEVVYENSK